MSPESENTFDLLIPEFMDLVIAASYRPRTVAVLGVTLAALLGLAAWKWVPAQYEAESLVHIRKQADFVYAPSELGEEGEDFLRAQKERAESSPVLSAALQHTDLNVFRAALPKSGGLEWARERLVADLQPENGLLSLRFQHTDARLALAMTTAITTVFVEQYQEDVMRDQAHQLAELEKAASAAQQDLNRYWQQLDQLAHTSGAVDTIQLAVREQLQFQGYRDYARQLHQAEQDAQTLAQRLEDARQRLQQARGLPAQEIERAVEDLPEVRQKQAELHALEGHLATLEKIAADPAAPRLVSIRHQRDSVAAELQNLQQRAQEAAIDSFVSVERSSAAREVRDLESLVQQNADEIAFLNDMLTQLEEDFQHQGKPDGVQLEIVRRTIDRQSRLADGLWKSLEQHRIESQKLPRISIFEAAKLPRIPNSRQQQKAIIAAAALGLGIVVLGIGYLEWLSCRVHHPSELMRRIDISLLGGSVFPRALGFRKRAWVARGLESGVSELVARVHASAAKAPTTILVTSAIDKEPRRKLVRHLGSAFATSGARVLLISAETGRQSEPELAAPRRSLGDHDASSYDTRDLMAEADSKRTVWASLPSAIEQARGDYQIILVLAPPLITSAESVLALPYVDGVVLAGRLSRSRWDQLQRAVERCQLADCELYGLLLA